MTNGNQKEESVKFPKIPGFPLQFTETDYDRMVELEERRKELGGIYLGHYTPEAWKTKPLVERAARRVAEAAIPFGKGFRDVTPWEETGFTPEQFDIYRSEIEAEYQNLKRNQLVLGRLSTIREHLTTLAMMGRLTGSMEQLYDLIPELRNPQDLPLRDVEREWIENFALSLVGKSRQEVLDIYASGGGELSPEEIMQNVTLAVPSKDPRFILSTVAFSKDLDAVSVALQQAYPPEIEEETSLEEGAKNEVWEEMRQKGLVPSGDIEADIKALGEAHAKELAELGIPAFLEMTDESGKITTSSKVRFFPNGDVFSDSEIGSEKIGTYNPETQEFLPLSEEQQLEVVDQIPFTALTEDGTEVELTYKLSDSSVWEGENLVGNIDEAGEFIPKEPEWYERALGYLFTGLEYASFPFSFFGMKMKETTESFKAIPEALVDLPEFLRGENAPGVDAWLKETLEAGFVGDITRRFLPENLSEEEKELLAPILEAAPIEEYRMGGEVYEKYRDLPWWQQLLYELPLYLATGAAGLTATRARAALAPTAARGGVTGAGAQAARTALAPVAGYEWLAGRAFYYVFGVPASKIAGRVSNKYFQAMWSKSFPSNIFKKGTPEYDDMFRIWKLYHTKPPAGQPADVYEQAARRAFQDTLNSNLNFREGILSWLRDMASKGATSGEAAKGLTLVLNAASSGAKASPSTQIIISNVVKQATEQNIPVSAVTSTFITKFIPEGVTLGKPSTEQLASLGYTGKAITDMSPEEAWSIVLSGREPVVQEGRISPEVPERVGDIDTELGRIKGELAIYQHSYNVQDAQLKKMETAGGVQFTEDLEESIALNKARIDGLISQQEALIAERDALMGQIDKAKAQVEAPPIEQPPTLVTEEIWEGADIPARAAIAKAAGLEGKVGSKSWIGLTPEEQNLITKQAKLVTESAFQAGREMSVSDQQRLLTQFGEGKPGISTEMGGIVYRDPQGNPIAIVTLHPEESGAIRVGTVINVAENEVIKGKATLAILRELKETPNLIAPDESEMSREGLEFWRKLQELIPREGIIPSKQAEAIETNKALAFDDAKAAQQLEGMENYPEGIIDPAEIANREPEGVPRNLEEYLTEADTSNPLDVAAVKAIYSGNIHDYADGLPPNFVDNVSQAFEDGEFYDASYPNLMRMDTYRAYAFIDNGRPLGLARVKILRVTEHLARAQMNKLEHYTSWYVDAEHRYHMNSPYFRSKEGMENVCGAIEQIKDFDDALKPIEEVLARPEVQEVVGKYPVDVQENIMRYAQEVRVLYEAVRADTNVVRAKLGKEPIPHLDNYLPWIYKTNIWGRLFGLKVKPEFLKQKGFIPDYIKASEPFNARALAREGGLAHYEKIRDPRRLMLDYFGVMTQDMFYTPIIQNAKAHAAVMKEKAPAAADWVVDTAVESYAGTPGAVSRAARKVLPPFLRNPLIALRRNLTRAVFPLNWTWNLFVQTSSLALTVLQQGLGYTIKGTQFLWNPKAQETVVKMFSYIIKQRIEGSLIYQDLGAIVQKEHYLTRSKLDTATHYANFLTRLIEQKVTGVSCYAGYLRAKDMGYSEADAIDFGSEAGAKSQSRYDIAGVPGVLRSPEVGAVVPFQTFAFEAFNSIGEVSGFKVLRAGAWRTAGASTKEGQSIKWDRLKKFLAFFAVLWAFNTAGEIFIRRKPWQPTSFIPFASLMMSGIEPHTTWNYPFPMRYIGEVTNAMKAYFIYGNWEPLTSWFVKYHTPGGVQIDRVIGGVTAVIDGEVKDVAGDTLYEIENNPVEWIKAITMGPYQTEGGREFRDRMEGVEPTTDKYLEDSSKLEEQLGKEIEGEYYLLTDYGRDIDNMLVDWQQKQETLIEEESMEWSGLPKYIITAEGSPFPPLAQFRVYSGMLWEDYYNIPSEDRLQYRKDNPEVEAVLYFWYKISTLRSEAAKSLVQGLFEYYGVMENPYMHPSQLPEVPEELKLIPE